MKANLQHVGNFAILLFLTAVGMAFLMLTQSAPWALVVLVVVGCCLLGYAAVRSPEVFLVGAVFAPQWKTYWPLSSIDRIVDLTIVMLACLAVCLAWRLLIRVGRLDHAGVRELFGGQVWLLACFLLFASSVASSYLYTNAPAYGSEKLLRFLGIGSLLLVAPLFLVFTERDWRRFARIFVACSALTTIQLIFGLEGQAHDANTDITRIGAGWLIGMAIVIVLFYPLFQSELAQHAFFFSALPFLTAGLIASAARGPMVGLAAIVLLRVVIWLKEGKLQIVCILATILTISGIGSYLVLRNADRSRYTAKATELIHLLSGDSSNGSGTARLAFYRTTIAAIPDSLVLGHGVGSWSVFYYGRDERNYPHNLFLELAFEEGLLGVGTLLLFLTMLGISILGLLKETHLRFLVLAMIVLYCVLISMFSGDLDDNRLLWLWSGMAIAILSQLQAAAAKEHPMAYGPQLRHFSRHPRLSYVSRQSIGGRCVMIRACVMTSVHPAFDARIFHKQCKTLVHEGYQVTLIAPGQHKTTCEGVLLEPVPQWTNRFSRVIFGPLAVYRKARQQHADVYHFHDPELIPIALLLRAQGRKVIYDIHEDVPRTVSYKTYIPRWLRGAIAHLLEILEDSAARWFSALVTATPCIAKRFSGGTKDVVVVHNYPRIEEIQMDSSCVRAATDESLLYVGMRITRARGAEEMVRAMGLLPSHIPARLKFIGRWDPPELIESLSRIPGWERTETVGFLGRAELASALHKARAGLVLLHPEPNYVTAQPVKLFEYMCAGLPIIASDLPGCRDIIEDARCGLLVDPYAPEEIAKAITYLWTHPAEADAMGRRGFEAVQHRYNWASQEKILLQLYRRLCGSPLPDASPVRCAP